jgi:oligoendopeptidase F
MFASFERTIHERSEAGEPLTPKGLSELWMKLNRRYYGPEMKVDPEIALEWARIPHFYSPFYVYQYCTGFSAAQALAHSLLEGEPGARERYLGLLSSGGSDYPIALLKRAGVDMSSPAPIKATIGLFEKALAEMEKLLADSGR